MPDSPHSDAWQSALPIAQLFAEIQSFKVPQLADWQPCESMDIDLRINANAQWYYRDSPIQRKRLVKLFSSILRWEADNRYYLVTPRIKYPVMVEDAPFQAVELYQQGSGTQQDLIFRTNVDDVVRADREHPIRMQTAPHSAATAVPYVEVRDGLQAKICRSVYYELAQLLVPPPLSRSSARQVLGVYSGRQFFRFGEVG